MGNTKSVLDKVVYKENVYYCSICGDVAFKTKNEYQQLYAEKIICLRCLEDIEV